MFEDRDTRAPAWAWLRGFAGFLLAWPLLSLLAANKIDFSDWEAVVIAVFGPAAVGLVLLAVDAGLTRLLGGRVRRQAVPSTLRDLSNVGVALAILLVVDVGLVTVFDDDPMIQGGDPRAASVAVTLLALSAAAALGFRGLARVVHGGPRIVDLGEGWDRSPAALRFLGYVTLIPTLLVCTVMIDYTLHGRDDFGAAAWVVLPLLLWLGLRSATARAPRWWARDPWEAWLRATSLGLPWWIAGVAVGLGFAALCLLIPFGVVDETMTTRGRVIAGFVLVPLGAVTLFGIVMLVARGLPALSRGWWTARRLARRTDEAIAGSLTGTAGQVKLTLRDGRAAVIELGEAAGPTLAWLGARKPG